MRELKDKYRLKPSWWDGVAVLFVLLLALGIFLLLYRNQTAGRRIGEIILNGEVLYEIDLDSGEDMEIELGGDFPCTVVVRNGEIGFINSTCPNGDCVRSGMLSESGDTAACLPNRAVITVRGDDVDAVVR